LSKTKKDKEPTFLNDLKEFVKLRLALLVVFSACITYVTALEFYNKEFEWFLLISLCIGGMLITISSNGFNQIFERDLDKLMSRTKNRPLPTKRMSLKVAWTITLASGISGALILWFFLNPLTGILGLSSLAIYSFIYTPMKQKSPWAVFIGAFPGAAPPLIGWAACEASVNQNMVISPAAFSLFCIQFMWQFPHFWAIAWRCHDDYKKAGFHLLPSPGGKDTKSSFQILLYTLFMTPIAMLPCFPDFGIAGFTASLCILTFGIIMLYPALMLFKTLEEKWATKLMFASFIYLPLVLLALLADQYY
jgi:protoheme IX farnesyltransferase